MPSGGRRLGGDPGAKTRTPAEAAARAAERRARDSIWCTSGDPSAAAVAGAAAAPATAGVGDRPSSRGDGARPSAAVAQAAATGSGRRGAADGGRSRPGPGTGVGRGGRDGAGGSAAAGGTAPAGSTGTGQTGVGVGSRSGGAGLALGPVAGGRARGLGGGRGLSGGPGILGSVSGDIVDLTEDDDGVGDGEVIVLGAVGSGVGSRVGSGESGDLRSVPKRKRSDGRWCCPMCTLINGAGESRCGACMNQRPAVGL